MTDIAALETVTELQAPASAEGAEGMWCERWETCLFHITITI